MHSKSFFQKHDLPYTYQQHEHGQSLTELALSLPILLLILLGAVDLGRVFYSQVAITNAAREAARYGAAQYTDTTGIKAQAQREAANGGITLNPSTDIVIQCFRYTDNSAVACTSAANGDKLRVTVTTNFQFITLYLFRVPSFPITTSTTMAIMSVP